MRNAVRAGKTLCLAAAAVLSVSAAHAAQFTIGGNYNYLTRNPAGTNPLHMLSLTIQPSAIFQENHEVGTSLGVTRTSQEISVANRTDTSMSLNWGVFYRFNYWVTGREAPRPIAVYAGPQMGLTRTEQGSAPSSTDFSIGGQCGANFMFSEKFAFNIHLFQWDTIFADDTHLVITQSIGVKYFF